MTSKRLIIGVGALAILIVGALASFWWQDLAGAGASPDSARQADLVQDKERRRRELMEEVARRQKMLEDRRLAEAKRLADQERAERDAAIAEAVRKQQADMASRNLAETERFLERERVRQIEIVHASSKLRQDEEVRLANARRLAAQEQERLAAAQMKAALKMEEERRLAETLSSLERERRRQDAIVQASIRQREQTEEHRRRSDEGRNFAAKQAPPAIAPASKASSTKSIARAPRKSRRRPSVATRSAPRSTNLAASRRARRGADHRDVIIRVLAELCPLRWIDAIVADLSAARRAG